MRRAALSAPVLVDTASAYHTGRCRDVSPNGLGLELGTSLPEGTAVELYFELPTGVALDVRAEIVRVKGESLGVRFKDLSAEDQRALAAYCDAWRGDLLQRCARRAESMSDLRVDALTESRVAATPYDASEAHSGVRVRAPR